MGLDLGTSTIKAVRCNPVYGLVGKSSREVEILSPEPGRKEIDAEKYFSTVLELIQELAALSAEPVAAIAWDAASGNTLLCDRNAKPLTPALSWLDTRLDWLPPETWQVREVTGWPRISSFPLMHLEYFRRNMPMTLRSAHVTMLNEWLSWRLTGERGIDFSLMYIVAYILHEIFIDHGCLAYIPPLLGKNINRKYREQKKRNHQPSALYSHVY